MRFPSMAEVEAADHEQLARWWRFLPGPGYEAIGRDDFDVTLKDQVEIMSLITERFRLMGGMTPELSKLIGWGDLEGERA